MNGCHGKKTDRRRDPLVGIRLWDRVGRRGHTGVPWLTDTAPNGVMAPAPLLGQHTDQVLTEVAGYDAARVAALRAAGVLQ